MAPWVKRGHSTTQWIKVTDATGRRYDLATGTRDAEIAKRMEVMVHALAGRGRREWALVHALFEKDPANPRRRRLSLGRLYDAWRTGDKGLARLRAELRDLDLAPLIEPWLAASVKSGAIRPGTARQYRLRIGRLLAEDGTLRRSTLSVAALAARRDAVPGSVVNQLAHLTAWSSFFNHVVERGALRANPLTGGKFKWPREAERGARLRYIARLADVQRFVAAFPDLESRAIAALREGVGADWDALEPMRAEHVYAPAERRVHLPGDKTHNRVREVQLEPWAWAHLAAYLRSRPMHPGARLFTLPYETYKGWHNRARTALVAAGVAIPPGYSPHNARHSFAVRKRREGWNDNEIANYLGNTAAEVARTYGRFTPTATDMIHDPTERRRALRQAR